MSHHDHGYKLLFSHPEMVEDLLRGFVGEDFVKELDFSTLERGNGQYVSDDLRERTDDVIWSLRFGDTTLYLYILLEFQSSSHRHMAVRLLSYIGLLYEDLLKHRAIKPSDPLPPVLPLVLYNGKQRWNAPVSLAKLRGWIPAGLDRWQPQLTYYVIDEGALITTALVEAENLAAALFQAEFARTPAEIRQVVVNLMAWLKLPEQARLSRSFAEFFRQILERRIKPQTPIGELHDLREVDSMLEETVTEWTQQWKADGLAEGRAKGLAEGRVKGLAEGRAEGRTEGRTAEAAAILLKLLAKRFGSIPEWATKTVSTAELEQLEAWIEQIFDVESLAALLADRH